MKKHRLKKEFFGTILFKGSRRIYLDKVMDEATMLGLQAEHPNMFEEVSEKKSKKED